jgi:hypothetical protein
MYKSEWADLVSKLLCPIHDYLTHYEAINSELKHAAKSELHWRGCGCVIDRLD